MAAFANHLQTSVLDPVSERVELHVSQHHHGREEQRGGVGQVQAGDVGGCAVHLPGGGGGVRGGQETRTDDRRR